MKKVLTLLLIMVALGASAAPAEAQEAIYLVRHAEQAGPPWADPRLTDAGQRRAKALAGVLKDAGIDVIFVSTRRRTAQTAEPVAEALNVKVKVHPRNDIDGLMSRLRTEHAHDRVLIVSHFRIIPRWLKALGHSEEVEIEGYDNLFVIFPQANGDPLVLRQRYGDRQSAKSTDFKVTLLGTGTPRPKPDRFGAATLVEAGGNRFLFDAGRGVAIRIRQAEGGRRPLASIDKLFLTHLHSDHVVGIPDLWLTGRLGGRRAPLQVWGPEGTESMMSYLQKAFAEDVRIRHNPKRQRRVEGTKIKAQDVAPGVVYSENGVKITAFLVDHSGSNVKIAFGYRIDFAGRSVVLSGDTGFSETLIKNAEGADLLVHEVAAYSEDLKQRRPRYKRIEDKRHTSPEKAGEIFTRVRPKLAVYTHIHTRSVMDQEIIDRTRKTYSGPLAVGKDLMIINVGEKVKVVKK